VSNIPADFRPPVENSEFVSGFADPADERIEVGVLFVGAGPASLAGAIRLSQLLQESPDLLEALGDVPVAVIEKGKYPGAHLLSGAVVNPIAFRKLFPDLSDDDFPFYDPVAKDKLYFLTEKGSIGAPFMPPTMSNHGNFVASISKIGKWLGEKAEEFGVVILNETPGTHLIVENESVKGVRTADKGRDADGGELPNFEPGSDISAKVTLLGEGASGHLSPALVDHFGIMQSNPQIYALGVKEVWEVPNPLDRVIHTMGWPLRGGKEYREFGGGFIYPMGKDRVSIGIVAGLDYTDSSLSTHDLLQELKCHPRVRGILEGGSRLENGWGAKIIPEGGYYSLPDRFHVPGALLLGDAAGLVNVPSLKGIHYAMWSGILAADSIFERLKAGQDISEPAALEYYDKAVRESFIVQDLHRVRNMRQAFQYGFFRGAALAGLMTITRGLFPGWRFGGHLDSETPMRPGGQEYVKPDNKYIFDKLSSVFASGNRSRDNQPDHIRLNREVSEAVGETWINMCPAEVYEWKTDENGQRIIQTNPTNCVQCGAIGAKGGRLTPPEGGSGPEYEET
jgi:electron-transferring-flavoprotein dehydrogenase